MKTSMQELIELLKELKENEDPLTEIHWDYFLKKEEKQIIDARADGLHNGLFPQKETVTHQQYFNETFKS